MVRRRWQSSDIIILSSSYLNQRLFAQIVVVCSVSPEPDRDTRYENPFWRNKIGASPNIRNYQLIVIVMPLMFICMKFVFIRIRNFRDFKTVIMGLLFISCLDLGNSNEGKRYESWESKSATFKIHLYAKLSNSF
jgi:hypothetical protein